MPPDKLRPSAMRVMLPPLIGIPGGFIANLVASKFPSRGYLGPEYYMGQAAELQLVILLGTLLLLPLVYGEARRFSISFSELTAGVGVFSFLSIIIAFFHGFFPVLLIFLMLWLWTSLRWQRLDLPPFRRGVWMCMGAVCGAMAGAIIHSLL